MLNVLRADALCSNIMVFFTLVFSDIFNNGVWVDSMLDEPHLSNLSSVLNKAADFVQGQLDPVKIC